MSRLRAVLGRSPLTDPRSLGSSMLFHAMLILLASVAAFGVVVPSAPDLPKVLHGELDPVDNRAAKTGGGGPGELGGEGVTEVHPAATGQVKRGQPLDPSTDALLREILPAPAPTDPAQLALPGPQTTGMGNVVAPGTGGGGGSGGGSGGGIGRGMGPGTEFFGAREHAGSFAYVIDCSGSMASHGALDIAKRELLASLGQLPPDAQFAVVFYNLRATTFSDPFGHRGLMAATRSNKERVRAQLASVYPDGGTDHMLALRSALALHPEVIFFLTDADLMTNNDAAQIISEAGKTRIQAVEFGRGIDLGGTVPLRKLAVTTGGTYRYLDVTRFPR